MVIVVAVAVLAGIGGAGYFVMQNKDDKKEETTKSQPAEEKEAKKATGFKLAAEHYEDPATGLLISYPEGWEESHPEGVVVTFTNPQADDGFSANINVVLEETTVSLDEYVAAAKGQIAQVLPSYKETEDRTAKAADGTSVRLIGGTFDQNGVTVRNLQVIGVVDGIAIIQTATSLESEWDTYKAIFEEAALN